MLAQFQSLYPKGCLTSELVQVYNGKYIVRASVQIETVTRATGMAMADSLEEAEDRARERALMVLNLKQVSNLIPEAIATPQQTQTPPPTNIPVTSTLTQKQVSNLIPEAIATPQQTQTPPPTTTPVTSTLTQKNDSSLNREQDLATTNNLEQYFDNLTDNLIAIPNTNSDKGVDNSLFAVTNNNVTPFTPRNTTPPEETVTSTTKRKKQNQPMDLSTAMAEIDIEMTRLGWGKEQGREHLIQTYNKRARSLLSDEELFDFLKHLKSLPSPISPPDPLAGF
jgi:hypothetical protein